MATLKQRLHRWNGSSYDTVHYETDSSVVLRPDGTNVEALLTEVQDNDTPPASLTSGKLLVGTSKVFIGINGNPYEVSTSAAFEEIEYEPSVAQNPTYTGNNVGPTWNNYDNVELIIGGDYTAVNQGSYTAAFTPRRGYVWASTLDRTTVYKNWTLNPATPVITAPTAKSSLYYNGGSQELVNAGSTTFGTLLYAVVDANASAPADSAYSSTIPTGTAAKSYDVYCRVAADATNGNWTAVAGSKMCTVTISKVTPTVTAPTKSSDSTYSGSSKQLTASAGSTNYGTLQYSTDNSNWSTTRPTATNVGSYTVYYRVVGDSNINSVASTSIGTVKINQAANTMSLSKTSITLNSTTKSTTFTISGNYDGTVSVSSSNTSVVTVSRSGSTVTVSSVNDTNGSATVTVSASGGNYTAASKTCSVTCSFIEDGEYGSKVIAGTKTKGSFVRFDGKDWIVVNVSGSTYTLMLKKITETTQFGSSTTYSGSTIASKCTTFQGTMSANALSVVNSKTVQSVTAKVWIATKSNIESWTDTLNPTTNAWSGVRMWTANQDTEFSNKINYYWCSDPYNSSLVWYINYNGYFNYRDPSHTYGFRPCIEVTQ